MLEAKSQKYRAARASTTIPYLRALRERNLRDALSRFFENNPNRGATAEEIAWVTGFSLKHLYAETRKMMAQKEVLLLKDGRLIGRAAYEAMKSKLLEAIRTVLKDNALKEAVNLEEAKSQTRLSADQKLVQEALDDLCRSGSLTKVGGGYQAPDVAGNLSREQENLIVLLLDFAAKSGLNPFSADTLWKRHERKIDKKMIQKHLEYLDTIGFTRREGDLRLLMKTNNKEETTMNEEY